MDKSYYDKLSQVTYESIKDRAQDPSLSSYEKVGFADACRRGNEDAIFADICGKMSNLLNDGQLIVDIGPGCTDLPHKLIKLCAEKKSDLILCDSEPILSLLPSEPHVSKLKGPFPECFATFGPYKTRVTALLVYSVLQMIYTEGNVWQFLDRCLELLAHGGQMLIGDVSNQSKRKRFFSSPTGILSHQEFTGSKEIPAVNWNSIEFGKIDDAVIFAILMRCRNQGFDAYVLPQPAGLPYANRREDIFIVRP